MSLRQDLLDLLRMEEEGLSENEISARLGLPRHLKKRVRQELEALVDQGGVLKNARHRYSAKRSKERAGAPGRLFNAVFSLISSGSGFARLEDGSEYFIPERFRGWALPGDQVEIRPLPPRPGKREEGERPGAAVTRVLARGARELVGTLRREGAEACLTMLQGELETDVDVSGVPDTVPDGDWIAAAPPGLDEGGQPPAPARFLSHLGGEGTAHLDTLILIRKHGLKVDFDPAALAEAAAFPPQPPESDFAGRLDLRGETVFTIDGADAKDFDDAVSIERRGRGWRLGVHIADVSHYVRRGTALDKEAYERATSVYLPDRVLPMLPEALSNGLCSLNPGVPRLTESALMDFDERGVMTGFEFAESVILSCRRFTYDEVQVWLDGRGGLSEAERPRLGPVLDQMKYLAELRMQRRDERGGLDFNFPETKVELDGAGRPVRLVRRERLFSHQLIEEFMLAANEAVATELRGRGVPLLFRVHENPDEEKLAATLAILGKMKLGAPRGGAITPKDVQKIMERVEGKPEQRLVHTLLLRSLRLARYTAAADIHFGLALENYCHFTSPIRRYPDLVVHRSLRAAVLKGQSLGTVGAEVGDTHEMGPHCSEMERKAEACERDCVKAKQVRYLEPRVGEEHLATVTSVTSFGFFAEIVEFPAEGLVPMGLLADDYYVFEPDWMRLKGRRSGRTFSIGDSIKIRIKRADWKTLQVDFELAEGE